MSLNRADLRLKIRELIQDFYDVDTVDTGGIDASSETLPVSNINRYDIGDTITIGTEHMKVRAVNTDDDTLTVTRAFQLSTAAAHLAAVAIVINPEFTDRALNLAITSAIADTFPDIWLEIVNEDTVTAATREYDIPSGFTFVRRIQIEDGNGNFQENRDWQLVGTKIQFTKDFGDLGRTMRIIGEWFQPNLTEDATALDISDEQGEYVFYKGALLVLEQRLGHRLKATEYSAAVNDRAGQPLEMIQMYSFMRSECDRIKARERKDHLPTYAMRPKR